MNNMLVDENGRIRNFKDFKEAILNVHKRYNLNYLQAEYQTAKRSAQMARQWQDFTENQDLFPNLEYRTAGDQHVREEHRLLEGIIRPINDPFWDVYYPPNGWRCRCAVRQTDQPANNKKANITVDEGFKNNVGKTKQVFNQKKHPYFQIPKSDKNLTEQSINNMLASESGNRVRKYANKYLLDTVFKIGTREFKLSKSNIKTIIQKPHEDRVGRNEIFYNLENNIKNAVYIKSAPEIKNRSKYVAWHYYKIQNIEGNFYINLVETKNGHYNLHAITDKIK